VLDEARLGLVHLVGLPPRVLADGRERLTALDARALGEQASANGRQLGGRQGRDFVVGFRQANFMAWSPRDHIGDCSKNRRC
jgi:hypothetical protein